MEDYPPKNGYPTNSHIHTNGAKPNNEEAPEKKIQKVTVNKIIRKKPPLGKRFKSMFLGGGTEGILSYVLHDVLLPAARDMAADAVTTLIERALFGDGARPAHRRSQTRPSPYTSYQRYSSPTTPPTNRWARDREDPRPRLSREARTNHAFDEIILATEQEARDVLTQLNDILGSFGTVSVADFYELVGAASDWPDYDWGWTDLRGAVPRAVRGGFELYLPPTTPINHGHSRGRR